MNPGKLNTRIVIWQLTQITDGYGGFLEGTNEFSTIWVNYKQLKGDRSTENGQRATRTDVELIARTDTIDYVNANATSNWFFKIEGESDTYRINNIFESEYKNHINILGLNCSVDNERIFTIPDNLENEITVKFSNDKKKVKSTKADCFELFIRKVLDDIENENYATFSKILLSDAKILNRLKSSVKSEF